MYHGIAIAGGNGSGKTTLGRQLSDMLGYKHMDIEDYYFRDSVIPYADSRTREEVLALLSADIKKYSRFILSSVNCDYGNTINAMYDLNMTLDDVTELGKDILRKERAFNAAAGFTKAHDRLPLYFSRESVAPHNVRWDVSDEDLDSVFNF